MKGYIFTGMLFTFLFFYMIIFSRNMKVNEFCYGTAMQLLRVKAAPSRVHNPKSVQLCTWRSARRNSNIMSKMTYTFVALVLLPDSKHQGMRRFLSSVPQQHDVMEFRRAVGLHEGYSSQTPVAHSWGYGLLALCIDVRLYHIAA